MRSPSQTSPPVRTSLSLCEKSLQVPTSCALTPVPAVDCTPSSHCRLRYHAVDCYRITLASSSARGTRHFVSAETERASSNRRVAPKSRHSSRGREDAQSSNAAPAVALPAARSRSGDLETAAPAERWRVDVAVEPALCNLFARTLRPSRSAAGCERSHSARRCLPTSARACRAGLAHGTGSARRASRTSPSSCAR